MAKANVNEKVADDATNKVSAIDYAQYAGEGFEQVTTSDLAMPFLVMLQALSAQCKKADPAYVEGASEGDIYNTLTGELFDGRKEGVEVIPCNFHKVILEWKLREQGGGLVGIHPYTDELLASATPDDKGRLITPNKTQLVATFQHFVLYKTKQGDWSQAVLSMAGSRIKKSRAWLSRMANFKMETKEGKKFTPPQFAQRFLLKSVTESKGQDSWATWDIQPLGVVTDQSTFEIAAGFCDTVKNNFTQLSNNASHVKQLTAAAGSDANLPM